MRLYVFIQLRWIFYIKSLSFLWCTLELTQQVYNICLTSNNNNNNNNNNNDDDDGDDDDDDK